MFNFIHTWRLWLAELINPEPIRLNLPTPVGFDFDKPVYVLGKVDPMSFSGVDTRIYISEEPFTLEEKGTVFGTAQGISWVINNHGVASGGLTRILLDSAEPVDLVGKYLTVMSANEYGQYAVLASFRIDAIPKTSGGIGVDDIIVEEHLNWRGKEVPEALKIHGDSGGFEDTEETDGTRN